MILQDANDVQKIVRLAQAAEQKGVKRLFIGYSKAGAGEGPLSSSPLVATINAVLAQTKRIKVGPGIVPITYSPLEIGKVFCDIAKRHDPRRIMIYLAPGDPEVWANQGVRSPVPEVKKTVALLNSMKPLRHAEIGIGVTWGKNMITAAGLMGKGAVRKDGRVRSFLSGVLINSVNAVTVKPIIDKLRGSVRNIWMIGPGLSSQESAMATQAYYGAAFPVASLPDLRAKSASFDLGAVQRIKDAKAKHTIKKLVEADSKSRKLLDSFMVRGSTKEMARQIRSHNRLLGVGVVLSHPFGSGKDKSVLRVLGTGTRIHGRHRR